MFDFGFSIDGLRMVSRLHPKSKIQNPKFDRRLVITIDGPAGAGKSTAAKRLARRLGLGYLDTGATYRALAYAACEAGVDPETDAARLARLAKRLPLKLRAGPSGTLRVFLDGVDVTAAIRTERVSRAAAQVSRHPTVRRVMVERQRALVRGCFGTGSGGRARGDGVVAEGRDAGSVVFPHAPYKFFLDADASIRAQRRQQELLLCSGIRTPLARIRRQLHFRDGVDRTRTVGPLVKPAGAVVLDTSHLTAAQVTRILLRYLLTPRRRARGSRRP